MKWLLSYLYVAGMGFPVMVVLWLWERKYPLKMAQAERAQSLVDLDKELFPNSRVFTAEDIKFMRDCQDLKKVSSDVVAPKGDK